MLFRNLTRVHPTYDAATWHEYRGLYDGGDTLLKDRALLRRVFPPHPNEAPEIYADRVRRASYLPYAGSAIDHIVAAVFTDPIALTAEPPAPAFYREFAASIDGYRLTLTALLRAQLRTALTTGCAWTLVDLPPLDSGAVIESERDEADLGLLRAFAFPVEPECVLDWDETPSGDLEWALVRQRDQARKTLDAERNVVTDRFTLYERARWTRWDVTYDAKKPPQPTQDIPVAAAGGHSFGAVPLARLAVPPGLHAMARLAPLCRALLNKRSGCDWALLRQNFPILAAFLGPEVGPGDEIPAPAAQDPGRATSQVYGIGRIVQFGDRDKLQYVAPDPGVFAVALQDLRELRDEIYRVVHQMALSVDNSAAALGRSGDSKAQDKAASAVVMGALGELARRHAVDVHALAAAGRRDPPMAWTAHGAQDFDTAAVADLVAEQQAIEGLTIPSVTFHRLRTFQVAKTVLAGSATPEQLDAIRAEIEAGVTEDSLAPHPEPAADEAGGPPDAGADGSPRATPGKRPTPRTTNGALA